MPNPTPQQRIETLVREFEEKFDECYPNMGGKNQSADIAKMFRQALKQAYLAGLEEVESGVEGEYVIHPKGSFLEHRNEHNSAMNKARAIFLSHISQLKEQIK